MEIYAVGGVVRDQLIGRPSEDVDYVVVGATPKKMLEREFIQVGRDFPVFLHPKTRQEYALARKERKILPGYTGFHFDFSPKVTLEEDLLRRDLTINAMARKVDHFGNMVGKLIDPYNGLQDLENKILRHVSSAFEEDPLRILRLARFAARLPDFVIDCHTQELAQKMVINGEINSLVPERIWKEMSRALFETKPSRFFEVLRSVRALEVIFPELDRLWFIPQHAVNRPEISSGKHSMMVLEEAALLGADLPSRWAALVHNLSGEVNFEECCSCHHDHKKNGLALVKEVCQRFKLPSECTDLALLAAAEYGNVHHAMQKDPMAMINLFERCDVFRRPNRFLKLLLVCEADWKGRFGCQNKSYSCGIYLKEILNILKELNTKMIASKYCSMPQRIKGEIFKARVEIVEAFMKRSESTEYSSND